MSKDKPKFQRTFLYSEEYPKGKLFENEEEYNQAIEDGWADAPEDIGKDKKELKDKRSKQAPPADLNALKKRIENQDQVLTKLKANRDELVEENEKLRKEKDEMATEVEENTKFYNGLANENEALKKANADLNNEIASLKKQVEDLNKKVKK